MTDATADAEIVEALALRKRTRLNLMLIFLLVASAGLWSAWETDFNLVELVKGWGHINNLLARMFPPTRFFRRPPERRRPSLFRPPGR